MSMSQTRDEYQDKSNRSEKVPKGKGQAKAREGQELLQKPKKAENEKRVKRTACWV